jgi:anti-sigma factor (TIGR02949 family)
MNVFNFDSKQCLRVREQMDAYLSNELLVETTSEVLRHLESCEGCSYELDSRLRLREALRRAADKRLPPEHLREAISQRLRRAQPGFFGDFRVIPWAVALASMVLAVVAGQQGLRFQRGRQLVSSILTIGVTDHVQCAIKGHNYPEVANPPAQLRKQLGPEYAGLLPIVQEKLPAFQVLEAHICQVPGSPRKYVHFITRGQGTILSVILTRREGESLPAGRFLVASAPGGVDLYKAQLQGMSVAGFESNEYFGFVVSDLGQDEMVQIAARLAPAMRDALSKGAGTVKADNAPRNSPPDSGGVARRAPGWLSPEAENMR